MCREQLAPPVTSYEKFKVDSNRRKPRISMITLGVRDLAASVKFYEAGLVFPRMESPPGIAFFTLNGSWLSLYSRNALADDATVSPEPTTCEYVSSVIVECRAKVCASLGWMTLPPSLIHLER